MGFLQIVFVRQKTCSGSSRAILRPLPLCKFRRICATDLRYFSFFRRSFFHGILVAAR